MALLCLLAAVDLALVGGALMGGVHSGGALLAHLFLSLAALAIWWRQGAGRRFAPVLGMALGPAGVFGAMVAPPIGALARGWRFLRLPPVDGLELHPPRRPAGSSGAMVARLLDGRVRHPDPASLGSLIGVMRHGSLDDRRSALETAVRSFDPRLSTVVAKALTDDDQTIRALAAAAASRLAQRLMDERLALAAAMTAGEDAEAARLRAALMDHSRFDVLLSDTQRAQLAREAASATTAGTDDEGRLIRTLDQYWDAQDFDMVDLLCWKAAQTDALPPDPLWTAARWWAAQPCS